MCSRQLVVVQSAHILYVYNLEDIVYSNAKLHIRTLRIEHITALREIHEHRTACVLVEIRVVLIRQLAPQDAEA